MTVTRVLFIVPLVLFLGMAAYFGIGLTKNPRILPSMMIDKPVPEFTLPALMADVPGLKTSDFGGGEVKIVNFFASWCIPCRAEHALLMGVAKRNLVPIYGINYKNDTKEALDWLGELGNPYQRIGADRSGRVGIEFGVYGLPETYIIDKQGRIRYRQVGAIFPDVLENKILPLIKELQQ